MTNPTPLSPAAQVIVNAAIEDDYGRPTPVLYRRLAAALRAAALYCKRDSAILLSLADELEGAQ